MPVFGSTFKNRREGDQQLTDTTKNKKLGYPKMTNQTPSCRRDATMEMYRYFIQRVALLPLYCPDYSTKLVPGPRTRRSCQAVVD